MSTQEKQPITWDDIVKPILNSPEGQKLKAQLGELRKTKKITPGPKETFRCFDATPLNKLKMIIVGDEPYIKEGFSNGLAFSTEKEYRPKLLDRMFKEIFNTIYEGNITPGASLGDEFASLFPTNNLQCWADQGILLLNASLTTEIENKGAHYELWKDFMILFFHELSKQMPHIPIIFYGEHASVYCNCLLGGNPHWVNAHTNPNCFHQANETLLKQRNGYRFNFDYSMYIDFPTMLKDFEQQVKGTMSNVDYVFLKNYLEKDIQKSVSRQFFLNMSTNPKAILI